MAPALGGATQLWAKGVLLLAMAAVFITTPPAVSLGRAWNVIFLALGGLALAAFLPAGLIAGPESRRMLIEKFGLRLPWTLSAQPWLGVEACCLYFAGLAWAYFLIAYRWGAPDRERAVRFYCIGVTALACVSMASYAAGIRVPFWSTVGNSPINFGFFPNRNETANVLALAAILMMALAYESCKRHGNRGVLWFIPILLTCVALAFDQSRAGVVVFFGGAAAWTLWMLLSTRSKMTGTLCLAGLVLVLAAFLLFGGETLRRFQGEPQPDGPGVRTDRVSLQSDALALTSQAPLLGQGIGNFEYLFPLYREKSAGQSRALHPESDLLWVAAEMGWPAALLLLIGAALWADQCRPFGAQTDRRLRAAAAVCGVAFLVHGLVDVPGHRAGTVWPALFLCSIALHPGRRLEGKPWAAPLFRGIGVVVALVGAWWVVSSQSAVLDTVAPTSCTLMRLKARSDAALHARDYPGVIAANTEALRIAPLDWRLYFQRAVAGAVSGRSAAEAEKDFAVARFLSPHWAESCFLEGELWLALGRAGQAFDAWKEALRRAGTGGSVSLFRRMLADAPLNEPVRVDLEELARANRQYFMVFLQFARPIECDLLIGDLLAQDAQLRSLTPPEKRSLFAAWFERGDRSLLISRLQAYPDWMEAGWSCLARDYAEKKKFQEAYEVAMRYTPAPPMLKSSPAEEVEEMEHNFTLHPDDVDLGMSLHFALRKLGRNDEALTLLLELAKIPGHPPYVLFLESQIYAERQEWEKAWLARLEYSPLTVDD